MSNLFLHSLGYLLSISILSRALTELLNKESLINKYPLTVFIIVILILLIIWTKIILKKIFIPDN